MPIEIDKLKQQNPIKEKEILIRTLRLEIQSYILSNLTDLGKLDNILETCIKILAVDKILVDSIYIRNILSVDMNKAEIIKNLQISAYPPHRKIDDNDINNIIALIVALAKIESHTLYISRDYRSDFIEPYLDQES